MMIKRVKSNLFFPLSEIAILICKVVYLSSLSYKITVNKEIFASGYQAYSIFGDKITIFSIKKPRI